LDRSTEGIVKAAEVIVTCVVLLVIGALVALPSPPVAAVETDLKTLTYFGISDSLH
jgi:hypothetical protein